MNVYPLLQLASLCFVLFETCESSLGTHRRRATRAEEEAIKRTQRNKECCDKNWSCCVKIVPPPIELRAVIARCPNLGSSTHGTISRTMKRPMVPQHEMRLKSFQGFDEDEPLIQSRITECHTKVLMTLKLHHKGAMPTRTQYIVVDHVYDPITDKLVRILHPYVIRLTQLPVEKLFHLKFIDYANSEAHEEVHNKQEANYTGCYSDRRSRPTCGSLKFDGRTIPYSQGFCCSCDMKKNIQRQPDNIADKTDEEVVSYSDPSYLLDRVGCPRSYYSDTGMNQIMNADDPNEVLMNVTTPEPPHKEEKMASNISSVISEYPFRGGEKLDEHPKRWKYTRYSGKQPKSKTHYLGMGATHRRANRSPTLRPSIPRRRASLDPIENRDEFTARLARKMRQTFPSGIQKRGGQNCADRYTPPGLDPEHYHESAHCLRFSDVWYGIYKLAQPVIVQSLEIAIFERYDTEVHAEKWREITNGTITLTRDSPMYEDALPSVSITMTSITLSDPNQYANWQQKRILIPEGVNECDVGNFPEMRGGPDEFLVVNARRIAIEGDVCDHIGVGFEAFFKQPNRCGLPRGTCLHNQPKHLWRNDKTLERKRKRGCFFLKYHANTTGNPIYVNETTGEKYLSVVYEGAQLSILDIEIKADQNAVIRDISNAVITEIYIDSTCAKSTIVSIKVINTGLVASKFMVQLSDFPLELPEYFSKIHSKMVRIAPQLMHIYNLEIRQRLPTDLLYCSAEVLNENHELVALRRMRIQKSDRCICAWYCLCACVASVTGLKCNPMSLEHFHAAGFEGALPIVTYLVHFTMLDDMLSVSFYFVLFLLAVLLLLGLCKAVLGQCFASVGVWGLSVVLDLPKPMKRYHERRLRHQTVVYDDEGWPVDTFTHKRVRNIARATEFCANFVFFFTYPLACTVVIFRRLCCPYYTTSQHRRSKSPSPESDGEPSACSKCCQFKHSNEHKTTKRSEAQLMGKKHKSRKTRDDSSKCSSKCSKHSPKHRKAYNEDTECYRLEGLKTPFEAVSTSVIPSTSTIRSAAKTSETNLTTSSTTVLPSSRRDETSREEVSSSSTDSRHTKPTRRVTLARDPTSGSSGSTDAPVQLLAAPCVEDTTTATESVEGHRELDPRQRPLFAHTSGTLESRPKSM